MAASINRVILIGNLGQEPDVRYMASGDAVATISVATSETWKDKTTGEKQERTEWHRVVFFGKLAEIVQQYLHKGSKIYVEGKLRTRKWQAQDGTDRYTTEVVVDVTGTMQMLDARREGVPHPAETGKAAPKSRPAQPPAAKAEEPPPFDDDIPF